MPTRNRDDVEAAVEALKRELLKRQAADEFLSSAFTWIFGLASVGVIVLSPLYSHGTFLEKQSALLPSIVALLMLGFRGSIAWRRRIRHQTMLLILAFAEAARPELTKPVARVRQAVELIATPVVSPNVANAPVTSPPVSANAESLHSREETKGEAFLRLVVKATSLMPKCDLGPVPRQLFDEWWKEQNNRHDG